MGTIAEVLSIGAMVVGMGLMTIGPFVGIYYWSKYERKKWLRLADPLGLKPAPSRRYGARGTFLGRPYYYDELVGDRHGLPVRLGVRVVVTGSGKNRSKTYYTYAEVDYRSLELGLSVTPRNMVTRFFGSLIGEKDLQIGDPEVDPYYAINGSDEQVVQRLLTTPYVHEALRAMRDAAFRPYISDESLRCERRGKSFDVGVLAQALDSAVDLSRRVLAARQAVGPSSAEHAVNTAWRQMATSRGFHLDLENTRMQGRCEGMHVEVDTQLRGGRRWTVFSVRFDRRFGLGLNLQRQGTLSGLTKLLGAQDIVVGDPIFDERFVVKGAPEHAVRALLTAEVRSRLVDLQGQATELEVVDDRLSAHVAWLVADAAQLESGIVAIARAGAALAQESTEAPGPYRR